MEKEKKTERTKERIFSAALMEFGTKGYRGATLNNICAQNHIAKGLVYHNFKNKDEIYMLCVEYSIDYYLSFMKKYHKGDDIKDYIRFRNEFFSKKPLLGRIFFEATLDPPKHLLWDIKAIMGELTEYVNATYAKAVKKMRLRPGISEEDAREYCRMFNQFFNSYYQSIINDNGSVSGLIGSGSESEEKMLDLMLYGISLNVGEKYIQDFFDQETGEETAAETIAGTVAEETEEEKETNITE